MPPAGGMEWFNAVYSSTYRAVLGSVYFVALDREVAAEITQEAFLRLWQRRDRMAPQANAKAWLIREAINLAVSHRRTLAAAWRRKVDSPEPVDPGSEALDHVELARAPGAPSPSTDRSRCPLAGSEGDSLIEEGSNG